MSQMQATVKWVDGLKFVGESGSGHCVIMDGPASSGGSEMGIRPMEMLLLGVGGCSSVDVILMLKKARQQVADCHCQLTAERAEGVPSPFRKIHLHFIITGHNLKESQIKRATTLSAEKYCSASITLAEGNVQISHDYEIIDTATE